MKKPKIEFVRSQAAELLLQERVDALLQRGKRDQRGNVIQWTPDLILWGLRSKLDCVHEYSFYYDMTEKEGLCIPKAVVKRCAKEFPDEFRFVYLLVSKPINPNSGDFIAFPGEEPEFLEQMRLAWTSADVEAKLAPLLKEELKDKVHRFLSSRALYARRAGARRVQAEMAHYAEGYITAWEKFGGEAVHPRPYVLMPTYGKGSSGVAYLLAIPPQQLLEEAENEFAVHLVMGA